MTDVGPVAALTARAGLNLAAESRSMRAIRQFRVSLCNLVSPQAPRGLFSLLDYVTHLAAKGTRGDLWTDIQADCIREFSQIHIAKGTLAQAIEWEVLKLQSRLWSTNSRNSSNSIPLFRNRHVHIGTLLQLWDRLGLETEEWLADQGYDTLLDVGPWGGFNFVLEEDGYTRMPFARLTLGVGGLPITPLQEQGGPLFEHFLPRYNSALQDAGVTFPDIWQYQSPKQNQSGRLLEVSGTHYLPSHTYERRTFIKVRVSREYETVEEITLHDFLVLLERMHFTTDWDLYRQQTKDVDARFDLQDFISLNHMVEGIYQRSAAEDRLLNDIKEAFRGTIRASNVLYNYLGQVVRSHWVENLYWTLAEASLGVKRYQRMVSFTREVCPKIPPRLLIPVRRHVQRYHSQFAAFPATLAPSA